MANVCDVIKSNIEKYDDKLLYVYYEGYNILNKVSYREFGERVKGFAGYLQSLESKGERALIILPSGIDYLVAYVACLFTNTISIPLYSVNDLAQLENVKKILDDSDAAYIITNNEQINILDKLMGELLEEFCICNIDDYEPSKFVEENLADSDMAYLQYTSGSTSQAKGVIISYENMYTNLLVMRNNLKFCDEDIFSTWLPLYFDMGLLGSAMNTLFDGATCYFTSAECFMKQPDSWLNAISLYKGTVVIAPNFAYEMCLKLPDEVLSKFDLSSIRVMVNGSELVRSGTLKSLAERFKSLKLNPMTFNPSYGLAENTLVVSTHSPGTGYKSVTLDENKLRENILEFTEDGLDIVACGKICDGVTGKIMSLISDEELSEDEIGELWVGGNSVANGYWNGVDNENFEKKLPNNPMRFFVTGDLGFMHEGYLYIVGRKKDTIIIRGKNFYSQDIEDLVLRHNKSEIAVAVAFSVDVNDQEELVIMAEMDDLEKNKKEEIKESIKNVVIKNCKIVPNEVVLCGTGVLPRTDSGKVQRQVCRKKFIQENL